MTDARIPDRWLTDRRILRLSTVDFRSFVMSLTWSVSNRTDGRVEPGDLTLIPGFIEQSIDALERAELWCPAGEGWLIVDFENTQSSKAQLEGLDHKRRQDRERQASKRARERGASRDSPSDVAADIHRDTKARQGQDRQGQALRGRTPEPWSAEDLAQPSPVKRSA